MAKQQFVAGETNRAEAVRGAVTAVGPDSSNQAVKAWMDENWSDFKWGTNPAAEIFAARKSLKKAAGVTISKKRGRKKKQQSAESPAAVTKTPPVTRTKAATPARSALSLAIELFGAAENPTAVLATARQIVAAAGSASKALEIVNLI